jgi:hypothetical protein
MADAAIRAYLFQCEGEDLYAVSHDITGSNIPRSPCTLGWRLCKEFQLARHLPVPAPILPIPSSRAWRMWATMSGVAGAAGRLSVRRGRHASAMASCRAIPEPVGAKSMRVPSELS